ncbi:MAG: hypothetical protein LBU48_06740 [Coriobacteriales bacterium]|jgi:hypothetical protein|nr:hypothetical protein [Coriobacteriales bacterium]
MPDEPIESNLRQPPLPPEPGAYGKRPGYDGSTGTGYIPAPESFHNNPGEPMYPGVPNYVPPFSAANGGAPAYYHPATPGTLPPPPKRSRSSLVIAIVSIALLLCCCCVFTVMVALGFLADNSSYYGSSSGIYDTNDQFNDQDF